MVAAANRVMGERNDREGEGDGREDGSGGHEGESDDDGWVLKQKADA